MKLNKKIIYVSAAALMAVSPALALVQNNQSIEVQAAKSSKNTITLRSSQYSGDTIPVYTKSGKNVSGSKGLKPGTTVKIYGSPISIKGAKNMEDFPISRIINGEVYYSLGDKGYIKAHNVGSSDNKGYFGVSFNSYIYDKNGKRIKNYRGQNNFVVKKNSKIKYIGQVGTYNPEMYYNIGNGRYVKATDIAKINGKNAMRLGYNSYVYNKSGKRIKGQGKLLKGTLVNYSGKISTVDNADFYYTTYSKNGEVKHALATKKIKGKTYYSIGSGRYINAMNVDMINGEYVYTDQVTYVTPKSDMYVLDEHLNNTDTVARRGSKIKVDGAFVTGQGDSAQLYYKLVGKDQYLLWGDASEYPNYTEGYFNTRFLLNEKSFANATSSYINFRSSKNTPLYDINGKLIDLNNGYLQMQPEGNQLPAENYNVDGAWYIWDAKENKAELYYHLAKSTYSVYIPNTSRGYKEVNVGNAFVKASEVDFHGIKLTAQNTAEEAKENAKLASTSQKDKLQSYVSNSDSVKNSTKYKLSSKTKRENYDTAISAAQAAIKSNTTTVAEVNQLDWLLEKSNKALDGAKVKVKNINNLTANEADRVRQAMTNANSSLPGFIAVTYYQKWEHKSGYYPSYHWVSSKKTVFMLTRSGYKNQVLKVSDYATEK